MAEGVAWSSGFRSAWLSKVPSRKRTDFPSLQRQAELRLLELHLNRSTKVLFDPELGEERRDPLPYRKEMMDLGVAGGAQT